MKKVLVIFTIILILITTAASAGWLYYRDAIKNPLVDPGSNKTVVVAENESLYELVDRLSKEGVLKDVNMIKLFYRLSGSNLTIKPGRHEIPAGADLNEVLSALKADDLDNITFTIPEGFTIENIAKRIEESGLLSQAEFIEAVKNFDAPSYVGVNPDRRYNMEGFLRPNTYTFAKGTSGTKIVREMSKAFENVMKAVVKESGVEVPESKWDEIVNKAAMIEREVVIPDERPIVASVIENRLKDEMRLQIDATILYAKGVDSKEITMDDILYENPYNTYHVYGLPAGPICNPSKESIAAAIKPAETDYIYYVANLTTGRHYFTADYDDFLAKRDEYANGTTEDPVIPDNTPEVTIPVSTVPENPYEGPVGAPGGLEIP